MWIYLIRIKSLFLKTFVSYDWIIVFYFRLNYCSLDKLRVFISGNL